MKSGDTFFINFQHPTLIPKAGDNKDYVITTPEGYYMASKGGVNDLVHFVVGDKVYLFDQFDLQYNRPDKVLEAIGLAPQELIESYRKAYEKRLKKMNFNPENFENDRSFNVPQIKRADNSDFLIESPNKKFKFAMEAVDYKFKLDRLNLYVNGVAVYGSGGKDLKKKNISKLKERIDLTLSNGKNVIEVAVLNEKGVESLKERFEVEYNSPSAGKGALHLITIGVSKYSNQDFNLQYADKDAEELKTLFESQKDNFSQIYTYSLTNEQATKASILALKEKLKNSSVDDHVYIFFSGHGVLNKDLDYYLATHDIDFSNPQEKGLLYDDFESLLDGIPARQKVLLVDASHSGEVDKDETEVKPQETFVPVTMTKSGNTNVTQKTVGMQNSFELMKELFTDLRRSTGATVISAAGGVQFAYEGINGLKNGVFTHCIKEGLANKAADLNKDGQVVLSELQQYVAGQVVLLTGGKQQPTSRAENLVNDFRVW